MAKITSTATLTSDTCSLIGSCSRPKKVVLAPNGTTAKAENAAVAEMIGARAKRSGSAARGRSSSLNISLMTSANGCSSPCQPTRIGPSRCCRKGARRRAGLLERHERRRHVAALEHVAELVDEVGVVAVGEELDRVDLRVAKQP